jgi:hypothetical protein
MQKNICVIHYHGPEAAEVLAPPSAQVFHLTDFGGGVPWFNGYYQHKTVVLPHFRGEEQLPLNWFLRILDGTPTHLYDQNVYAWALYDTVIVTSRAPLNELYPGPYVDDQADRLAQVPSYLISHCPVHVHDRFP